MKVVVNFEGLNEEQKVIIGRQSTDYIAELEHAPKNISDAVNQLLEVDKINQRIERGFYKDKFVLIAALPKSASTSLGSVVKSILGAYDPGGAPWPQNWPKYMRANHDSDLRPDMFVGFPDKCVIKHHTHVNTKNLKLLNLLGNSYIIGVRHPADQLIALYCHYRDPASGAQFSPDGIAYDQISPFLEKHLRRQDGMEDFFSHLIYDGYLESLCKWMSDWVRYRNPEKSLIVRYEDFIAETKEEISRIFKFFHVNTAPPGRLEEHALEVAENLNIKMEELKRQKKENAQRYPHGFSGDIGIYRKYFSDRNINEYNEVIDTVLSSKSLYHGLRDIYPDLKAT